MSIQNYSRTACCSLLHLSEKINFLGKPGIIQIYRRGICHWHEANLIYLPDMTQKGVTFFKLSVRLLDEQKRFSRLK